MTDTKFKFGDKVIVKNGFYRGMAGKVIAYYNTAKGFFKSEAEMYHIKTDAGNIEIQVYEDQIELVGVK